MPTLRAAGASLWAGSLARQQHHQRIDALLPQRVVVLDPLDRARGESAHVMYAAHDGTIGNRRRCVTCRPPDGPLDKRARKECQP